MLSHLLPSLSTILYCCILFYVHYCPLLPTIADYCLLLPTIAYYCLLLHTIVYCILVTNPLLSGYLVLSHLLPSLSTILYYCILFYVHFCLLLHTIVFYCGDQPPPLRHLVLSHLLPSLSHHPLSCLPALLKSTQLQASLLFDLTSELRCLCVYYCRRSGSM